MLCLEVATASHCRLINIQNVVIEKDTKKRYAEPNSMRKQNIDRHLKSHGENTAASVEKQLKDKQELNNILAISKTSQYLPNYDLSAEETLFYYKICEYSRRYNCNPIADGTVKTGKRSLKHTMETLSNKISNHILKLLNNKLKIEKECLRNNGQPKNMFVISIDFDHARMKKMNFGAVNLVIRRFNMSDGESNAYSLPFKLIQVAEQKGKQAEDNIQHLTKFIEEEFSDHRFIMSVGGDKAFLSPKYVTDIANNEEWNHLLIKSFLCVNHADPLIARHGLYRFMNDFKNDFSKILPKQKPSDGEDIIPYLSDEAKETFKKEWCHFWELIMVQSETDKTNIRFHDQVETLQRDSVRKNGANNDYDPLSNYFVDMSSCDIFEESFIPKHKIHRVPIQIDNKQRRLEKMLETMVGASQYAEKILDNGQFNKFFTNPKLKIGTDFLHKMAEYVALMRYTKSQADSTKKCHNMPLLRYLNIAVAWATKNKDEPWNNELLM